MGITAINFSINKNALPDSCYVTTVTSEQYLSELFHKLHICISEYLHLYGKFLSYTHQKQPLTCLSPFWFSSLLNYVAFVPTCLTRLRVNAPYVPLCTLRASNYYVPTCLHALIFHVPTCLHACIYFSTLRAFVP